MFARALVDGHGFPKECCVLGTWCSREFQSFLFFLVSTMSHESQEPLENQRSNTGTKIRDFLRDTKSLSLDNMCCTKEEDGEEEWTDVRHALETGASMKKRHEVVKMAPIVNMLAKQCKAETVFDIGSGQGHLYVHYHNTRCVESKTPHTHKQRSYVGFKVFLTCCGC